MNIFLTPVGAHVRCLRVRVGTSRRVHASRKARHMPNWALQLQCIAMHWPHMWLAYPRAMIWTGRKKINKTGKRKEQRDAGTLPSHDHEPS